MDEALKNRFTAVSAERIAREEAIKAQLTSERMAMLRDKAHDHATQHFANALDAGLTKDEAFKQGATEAEAMHKHLVKTAIALADPTVEKRMLSCGACHTETTHACVTDANGEIVATCECGRFHKIPKTEA